ncbi:hypothetical protein ABES02_28175 [Neobacillus pocheonensis]|uniref:hypothetical protein n=1 Tax=Neobacillus pocheonensis TaxID=363869 RepID=UPI003D2929AB
MEILSYEGYAYRQSEDPNAPWLVNLVIPAEELLRWAGIPRRLNEDMIGFQRVDDPNRVIKAKKFFSMGLNQSPTALVVGIHPAEDDDERLANLVFSDIEDSDQIKKCTLTIKMPVEFNETEELDELIKILRKQIEYRISAQDQDLHIEDEEIIEMDSNKENSDENDSDVDEVEIGMSKLLHLLNRLEDRDWCYQNIQELRDMAKPATIIDGQHRVKGAELCERNIPFTVCAVYNCPWSEQVFQFTVVNYTAKGIPDQFITANAALSLTKTELEKLQGRLVQAGVKVKEHELMQVVQWDNRSPFYGLVNLTEKKDSTKIGYKTMVSIAKTFYDGKEPALQQIIQNLYPEVQGRGMKTERLNRWKSEHWGLFFLDFWEKIYNNYKDTPSYEQGYNLWSVGHSNLVKAVVLKELQSAFLLNLGHQDEEFFIPRDSSNALNELREKLRSRAEKLVQWIPAEFFATEWKTKGLDTGPGRLALQEAFRNLVDKKGVYQYTRSSLVTGAVD